MRSSVRVLQTKVRILSVFKRQFFLSLVLIDKSGVKMKNIYRFCDINFEIEFFEEKSALFLKDYKTQGQIDYKIKIRKEETDLEHQKNSIMPRWYAECLVTLVKINKALVENFNGFVFHASVIKHDGKAYAISARSGVGKSSHARFIKEYLGEKVEYLNDDKPFIRYFEDKRQFVVYGNPWQGKHSLGNNDSATLSAVCFLSRNQKNNTYLVEPKEILKEFLEQVIYPSDLTQADKLLYLIDKLLSSVKLYKIERTFDLSAGKATAEQVLGLK